MVSYKLSWARVSLSSERQIFLNVDNKIFEWENLGKSESDRGEKNNVFELFLTKGAPVGGIWLEQLEGSEQQRLTTSLKNHSGS